MLGWLDRALARLWLAVRPGLRELDIDADRALGDPYRVETVSAWAARARDAYRRGESPHVWGCVLCRLLDAVAKDHCNDALAAWGGR